MKIYLVNFLIVFLLIFSAASCVVLVKLNYRFDAKLDVYAKAFQASHEQLSALVGKSMAFEATGYKAEALEDGRIKVVFLKRVAERDAKEKTDWAEFREVIMPGWMFAQVATESALKLGFEAMEKKAKSQKDKE